MPAPQGVLLPLGHDVREELFATSDSAKNAPSLRDKVQRGRLENDRHRVRAPCIGRGYPIW
eukprot:3627994-Lingulodinium_polyedra.AAC.1